MQQDVTRWYCDRCSFVEDTARDQKPKGRWTATERSSFGTGAPVKPATVKKHLCPKCAKALDDWFDEPGEPELS